MIEMAVGGVLLVVELSCDDAKLACFLGRPRALRIG